MSDIRPKSQLLLLAILIAGAIISYLWLMPGQRRVAAEESDLALAVAEYPDITGSDLDSCYLCHTTDVGQNPPLNSYGEDYDDAGRDQAAFALIEALDSDGDTYSNVVEINALSLPGDASSTPPAHTPTPTSTPPLPTATPTNTPVPPSPTPTNTPVPPSPTPTNTPQPPSPTPTNTPLPPSPTPTNTPVPPSPTPTNTPIPPPATPTNTPVPPTATPTDTPVPPTSTPTQTPTATAEAPPQFELYLPLLLVP